MKVINIVLVFVALVCSQLARADMAPTPISGDARLVEFDYNPESVYLVLTRPLAVTNIIMPKGEKIKLLKAGDTYSFMIEADKGLTEIFIKPKFEGVETTLTVVTTNKRFQYVIRSTGKNRKYYQQVSYAEEPNTLFEFGDSSDKLEKNAAPSAKLIDEESSQIKLKGVRVNPSELNTNYTITGDAKFKPVTVYDNGKFIWLKFSDKLTELPAIFAKDSQGLYLVNYVPDMENVVIVQQMADELILKIDKDQVSVRKGKRGLFGWSND
ncbi:TrbG/VirB9 family P-type conjugative transfer protein [Comamonas sp. w2-DMI]|uniref:TrbG/VirB9 family P-type conjugative transfer protein n=1 Tax=Comamonas sp. w2-DMI TaxID=3126391 RepID=UPI0032E3DD71